MVPRGGISFKEMNADQRSATMAVLASVLSARGLEKVQEIMEGDEVNKLTDTRRPPAGNGGPRDRNGGPPDGNGGPRPGMGAPRSQAANGPMFGRDLYYFSFLGTPSEKDPWMPERTRTDRP